jgi:molecular chaperone Hsp33
MTDHIVRAVSAAGGIRALACTAAGLAREVCALQSASATVSIALGRGLAGGALMGALLKPGQRVALKFEGNGPMGKMIIEADSDGAVRGSAGNPAAEMEPVQGRWNVPRYGSPPKPRSLDTVKKPAFPRIPGTFQRP